MFINETRSIIHLIVYNDVEVLSCPPHRPKISNQNPPITLEVPHRLREHAHTFFELCDETSEYVSSFVSDILNNQAGGWDGVIGGGEYWRRRGRGGGAELVTVGFGFLGGSEEPPSEELPLGMNFVRGREQGGF